MQDVRASLRPTFERSKMGFMKALKWQFLPAVVCFNLAYLISYLFPFWCFILIVSGLAQVIYGYYNSMSISPQGRGVLITGCDSGFGHQLAEKLHSMDFTVFAGCRDEKSYGALGLQSIGNETGRLHVIKLDVTSNEDVKKAREYVENHLPALGMWAVVNNAGRYIVGFLEWLAMEDYNKVAAVNLFGAIRVTKEFLPLIRKSHGRVVNVSSILGRIPDPFLGAYSITKFALEAYSDILRFEMIPFNVKVSMIEPGNFLAATNVLSGKEGLIAMANKTWHKLDESIQKDYGKETFDRQLRIVEILMKLSERDSGSVVSAMTDAVYREYPKHRYLEANLIDKAMAYCIQFVPTSWTDSLRLGFQKQLINLYR
ncbi:D-beta-hydroxybutyrate dehydrogenase, mitochondrial [Daphnia magna]|uniref:D-beta-hydroxybutyrate dehydrogenase, mitochondrial n=1 Tax=Daphnia magna TaxID=35525 RepID=UPI001E1BB5F0|nr:D-beta-hydroxybutyrate dehydrogenase, mitochondrial [Daphnia magna]